MYCKLASDRMWISSAPPIFQRWGKIVGVPIGNSYLEMFFFMRWRNQGHSGRIQYCLTWVKEETVWHKWRITQCSSWEISSGAEAVMNAWALMFGDQQGEEQEKKKKKNPSQKLAKAHARMHILMIMCSACLSYSSRGCEISQILWMPYAVQLFIFCKYWVVLISLWCYN